MSRSRNHSCSCWMCQPHKHGVYAKMKPSEYRKAQQSVREATDEEFAEALEAVLDEHWEAFLELGDE